MFGPHRRVQIKQNFPGHEVVQRNGAIDFRGSHSSLAADPRATVHNLKENNYQKSVALTLAVFVSFLVVTQAHASEIDELKATIQSMLKSMEQMQARIS